MKPEERMAEYGRMVNEALEEYLPPEDCLQKNVCEAMRYSLMAGGKRIRPLLVLEFCRVCGGEVEAALPLACAIEMIHTYSLIHDDLPCMDNDDTRRGRPSCHVQFGEATALLAGDALLSLAFETALCNNYKGRVEPQNIIKAGHVLAKASGALGMVGGQIIDLEYEGRKASLSVMEEMHRNKTGAMIEAAAKIGCLAAGAEETVIESAGTYAKRIGLVFQIVDDLLDVTSSGDKLGKPVGSDDENNKSTYVTLLGIENSRKLARQLTDEAIRSLNVFGAEGEFLKWLADFLVKRDR